jgi:hypothetical protein
MIKCCKDCEDRYFGCHSECDRYLKEKKKSAKNQRDWQISRIMYEYGYDKTTKLKRKNRR